MNIFPGDYHSNIQSLEHKQIFEVQPVYIE